MQYFNLLFLITCCFSLNAQSYTSYFTGHPNDTVTNPLGGICMMGGASEHDEAMKWFLQKCNGGDVLVLRASGSNGYNSYLYSQLGIQVNSVESIVCHNASASNDPYIHQKITQAEGIWFAGGDQWDYVNYWRNTPVDSLINLAIQSRNIVIGGTSAGMAILGGFYFSAQNGSVTSDVALANPYDNDVTVDSIDFLHVPFLRNAITDTHYSERDRQGRHVVFLARILQDWGIEAKGIACDEYTSVCIDVDGIARVYGDYPSSDDNAFFIQTNCELPSRTPEDCMNGNPLTWDLDNSALKVYNIKGNFTGTNSFNLHTWTSGTGGEWQNWFVIDGILDMSESDRIHCQPASIEKKSIDDKIIIYPNPCSTSSFTIQHADNQPDHIELFSSDGRMMNISRENQSRLTLIYMNDFPEGLYYINMRKDQ